MNIAELTVLQRMSVIQAFYRETKYTAEVRHWKLHIEFQRANQEILQYKLASMERLHSVARIEVDIRGLNCPSGCCRCGLLTGAFKDGFVFLWAQGRYPTQRHGTRFRG